MSDVLRRQLPRFWAKTVVAAVLLVAGVAGAQEPSLDERLEQAARGLGSFNFVEAYREFRGLSEEAQPGSPAWQKAMLGRALCAQHITPANPSRLAEARGIYEQLAGSASDQAIAAHAVISLGRIAELRDFADDPVDLETARRHYQQAIERWPDSATADQAALWLAGTHIQRFDDPQQVREGVRQLESWLAKRPDNVYASAMWLYLGDTYFIRLNQRDKAVPCYVRADELGLPVKATAGLLYWRMAVLAEQSPDTLDIAIRYYQKIISGSPTSGRAYEAQQALRRLSRQHPQRAIEIPQIRVFNISSNSGQEGR